MVKKMIPLIAVAAVFLVSCSARPEPGLTAETTHSASPGETIAEEQAAAGSFPEIQLTIMRASVVRIDGKDHACITKNGIAYIDLKEIAAALGMDKVEKASGDDGKSVWTFTGDDGTLTYIESVNRLVFDEDQITFRDAFVEDDKLYLPANALLVLPVNTTVFDEDNRLVYELNAAH